MPECDTNAHIQVIAPKSYPVPLVFIVFNRPEITKRTFELIKLQKPSKLFIVADGPRLERPEDVARCAHVRKIVEEVDWPCEVYRNYSASNLGCFDRVISGLNWVFEHVDRAIILEDDVMPHSDFFPFCGELLDRYADDLRVSVITANNFQRGVKRGSAAYYFSCINHVWGWATWRRAWILNDPDMSFWPTYKKSPQWRSLWKKRFVRKYWEKVFDRAHSKLGAPSWDYNWTASIWAKGGLTVTPNGNLVSNIGFGPDATHTTPETHELANMPTVSLGELTHPFLVERDEDADDAAFEYVWNAEKQLQFPVKHWRRLITLCAQLKE